MDSRRRSPPWGVSSFYAHCHSPHQQAVVGSRTRPAERKGCQPAATLESAAWGPNRPERGSLRATALPHGCTAHPPLLVNRGHLPATAKGFQLGLSLPPTPACLPAQVIQTGKLLHPWAPRFKLRYAAIQSKPDCERNGDFSPGRNSLRVADNSPSHG